ncbi:EAL and HDOD domain-containing protein [Billgrantia aerodenitrificans]|uniref:HDOD domain-containing protein n=1 Tax=Billgrantia aerodenitrificans TaxID=2733483 RepID=A0ABS9AYA6_9GAMM|nr:HDOD domain-containing protein [Halomonas aerodenitrificans]MCE8026687.1 HDOD domain-containing protein [Halomonas aerodenitrificans]
MTQGTGSATSLLLASQPIFDRHGKINAVELLYRSETGLSVADVGEDVATAEVVYQLCTAITQRVNAFKVPAFVNVSAEILLSPHFLPLTPNHIVVELVERLQPTQELIEAVQCLHARGYRFALDDFAFKPSWEPLISMASYIKVDISSVAPAEVKRHKERLSHLNLKWVAERIETLKERDIYLQLGFDLFQGYYYARPTPVYGKKIPTASLHATALLHVLHQPEPGIDEIIALVEADPELALKLTRVANSAFYRPRAPINSLHGVVTHLGLRQLTSWVALFGLLGDAKSEHAELALTRAKACEMLAKQDALREQDAYFIGLISTAELLLGVSREEFLECLELDAATTEAIVHRKGDYGSVLQRIEATERHFAMRESGLSGEKDQLMTLYCHAHNTAFELLATLAAVR